MVALAHSLSNCSLFVLPSCLSLSPSLSPSCLSLSLCLPRFSLSFLVFFPWTVLWKCDLRKTVTSGPARPAAGRARGAQRAARSHVATPERPRASATVRTLGPPNLKRTAPYVFREK